MIKTIQTRIIAIMLIPNMVIAILLSLFLIHYAITTAESTLYLQGRSLLSYIQHDSWHAIQKKDSHTLNEVIHYFMQEKALNYVAFFNSEQKLLAYGGKYDPALLKSAPFNQKKMALSENMDALLFLLPVLLTA